MGVQLRSLSWVIAEDVASLRALHASPKTRLACCVPLASMMCSSVHLNRNLGLVKRHAYFHYRLDALRQGHSVFFYHHEAWVAKEHYASRIYGFPCINAGTLFTSDVHCLHFLMRKMCFKDLKTKVIWFYFEDGDVFWVYAFVRGVCCLACRKDAHASLPQLASCEDFFESMTPLYGYEHVVYASLSDEGGHDPSWLIKKLGLSWVGSVYFEDFFKVFSISLSEEDSPWRSMLRASFVS